MWEIRKDVLDGKTVKQSLRETECDILVATVLVFAPIRARKHPLRNYTNLVEHSLNVFIKLRFLFFLFLCFWHLEYTIIVSLREFYLIYHLSHLITILLQFLI